MKTGKKCIIDTSCSFAADIMKRHGFELIGVIGSDRVSTPISRHADVLYNRISDDEIIISGCQRANIEHLEAAGYKVIIYDGLQPGYSTESRLNFVANDKYLIHNPNTSLVREYPELLNGRTEITVRQGYTRCSILQLNEDAYVSSDEGIFKTLKNRGIDCYYFNNREIRLEGYDCCFIGGSTARIDRNKILIFGDISDRSSKKLFQDYCYSHGFVLEFVTGIPVTDIGSALII